MSAEHLRRAAAVCGLLATVLLGAVACKEDGGVRVDSLKFNGLEAVEESQLQSVLATNESSSLPWGEKRYFSREQFEADLKRIVAFYRDRGFPNARVTSFDVELNEKQTAVDIVINIEEGEPIVAQRVELTGFEGLPADHRATLERTLPLQAGMPLDRSLLQASREMALSELTDHGHPYASVKVTEKPGSGKEGQVVTFAAEPGPLVYHGPLEIQGNSSVSDTVIRRQLTFREGDLYRQSKMLESQRNLYALEVFQFANVQPLREEGEKPTQIPTRITVTEGKHRKVNFSVGYGTEEKARVGGDWRHVNFFGGARTAGIQARYSGLDRGVKVNLTQPYLISPRYSLGLQAQNWFNDEPGFYELLNLGGRITLTRTFGPTGRVAFRNARPATSLALTYANEYEDYQISDRALADLELRDELIALGLDPRTGTGSGQRSALSLDGSRNTTDNILDAKRGYVANLHLEQAGTFLGGKYDYREITGEGRYYLAVSNRAVLAWRIRGGTIDPNDDDFSNVPFYKRYFLGGATNLRGWGRFEVAPLSGAGLPLGGHTFMNFSTEVRVPIWGDLGAVVFFDGGNVWDDPWNFDLNDMRYDVGPGLRYNSPVGPIRVDVGYQLNPLDGLLVNGKPEARRFRFHFSIGQAF